MQSNLKIRKLVGKAPDIFAAMEWYDVDYWYAAYWKQKAEDPYFHPGKHGGPRVWKFSEEQKEEIKELICDYCVMMEKIITIGEIKQMLAANGYVVSKTYIAAIFRAWKWSFKRPSAKQILKYTPANINYYFSYLHALQDIPFHKLHFVDESHFQSRDLFAPQAIAPVGQIATTVSRNSISASISLTLLTTLKPQCKYPFKLKMRCNSNTAVNFLEAVEDFVSSDAFEPGDIFILDNAAVHCAEDVLPKARELLESKGVRLIFLPTYSPELNPCERIFAQLKNYLRYHRNPDMDFVQEILNALLRITFENVIKYYHHCISYKHIQAA